MSFSQPFSYGNDELKEFNTNNPTALIKTSFYRSSVLNFLDRNSAADRILVETTTHPVFQKETFILKAKREHILLEELLGDLPCPNQCVPPLQEFLPYNNSFSIDHIFSALSTTDCFLLNVHFATWKYNDQPVSSSSVYCVTGGFVTPVARINAYDNIFISILRS